MLNMCHGMLPKADSALFTTLNWERGGGGRETEVCFVNVQLNFVRFAGMLSMVLSKIVGFSYCIS